MDCDGLRGMDAWKGFDSTPKDGSRYLLSGGFGVSVR